jgi:hypothetical protein
MAAWHDKYVMPHINARVRDALAWAGDSRVKTPE